MPMPPIKKIPPKYWAYGVAVLYPIVKYAGQMALQSRRPEPRTCPSCTFAMVSEVGKRKTNRHTFHYWRCSACAARYRSESSEGPFSRAADHEWAKHVRLRFPR